MSTGQSTELSDVRPEEGDDEPIKFD